MTAAPLATDDDRIDWLRLLRSRRVGAATFMRLLRDHGTARDALRALPGVARAAGVDDYAPCPEGVAQAEYRAGTAMGARLVLRGEPAYPTLLALVPDAPPLLWALGDTGLLSRPVVALVGARHASSLGLRMTRLLAEGLGQKGFVVASGLARGIDTAAHKAALATGTVAVMAGGVDHVYPPENDALAADIARQGLRLSEHPIGLEPQARHFPARNRIVSGLAHGVVLVEAAERSGSLITARCAAEQGREVMAVPGHPMDPRAAGCNLALREGATLVRDLDDILEALALSLAAAPSAVPLPRDGKPPSAAPAHRSGPAAPTRATAPPAPSGDLRDLILERLASSPLAEDQLIRDLGAGTSALAPALMDLELEGRIVRQPGGLLARAA